EPRGALRLRPLDVPDRADEPRRPRGRGPPITPDKVWSTSRDPRVVIGDGRLSEWTSSPGMGAVASAVGNSRPTLTQVPSPSPCCPVQPHHRRWSGAGPTI